MNAGSLLGNFLQILFDSFFANTFRFVRHFRLPKGDRGPLAWNFVITLAIVLAYGLVTLFSASYSTGYAKTQDIYQYIRPQVVIALVGFVLMLLLSNLNYRALQYAHWPLYLLTIILLVWALFSEPQNGHYRWVFPFGSQGALSSISIQPSEIAKFSAILGVATYTDAHFSKRGSLIHGIIGPLLPLVPFVILLLLEPHRSAVILIALIIFTMMLCGGCGLRWMPLIIPAGAIGALFMLLHVGETGSERLGGTWGLSVPKISDLSDDWQTLQSLYAVASGGLTGLGIGNGRQKHQYLPENTNDFIFSVLCEELGFIGAVICMALFAALIVQGVLIALKSPDYFGTMLGIGITAQVAWQTLLHIGVVTATIPNTGVSLPFFSSGGTSLLLLLAQMGILLSISRAGNAQEQRYRQAGAQATQQIVHRRARAARGTVHHSTPQR